MSQNYLSYEALRVYDIDYIVETSMTDAVEILKNHYGKDNCKFDKNTMQVTISLDGVIEEIRKTIVDINKFMAENKPVDKFARELWSIQSIVNPNHPKILCDACGLVDMLEFSTIIYKNMMATSVNSVTYILEICYDYHF